MKSSLFTFFLFFLVTSVYAQLAMYVNHWYEEQTYYGDIAKLEKFLNRLPININISLDKILKRYIGEYAEVAHFRNAQVIDLEPCFKDKPPGDRDGVIPAYEVHYYISIPAAYTVHFYFDPVNQHLFGSSIFTKIPGAFLRD